jgi:beta-phosphoglucomutase-like phosphatase (HAD superfamily)
VDAVIFDLDGTLVDSMPVHFEAYRQVLAEVGIELAEADFYAHIGGKASETIPRFLAGRPCPLAPAEVHARKKALVGQLIARQPPRPLASAVLLPCLHGHFRLALASSGSRPGVEQILAAHGWTRYFDVVLTGEDVTRGKPAPDVFLLAAERLGVAPAGCLVVEDTRDGVAAARAAGMAVLDLRDALSPTVRREPA